MREVVLTIPRLAVEDVLDRLLPIAPGGVRERPSGPHVELRLRGDEVPATAEIKAAIGRWPHTLDEREVSDDWHQRRLDDYEPDVIGGRLLVRPEWAPPAEGGLIEIVLGEGAAFGGGSHPTTRACLEMLLEIAPLGGFADLGCGTGVLAILAAKLGWSPVHALDVQDVSVAAAAHNAARNEVEVGVEAADLTAAAPPVVDGYAANVPAAVHVAIARALPEPLPAVGMLSGFGGDEAEEVVQAHGLRGLRVARRVAVSGWEIVLVERAA